MLSLGQAVRRGIAMAGLVAGGCGGDSPTTPPPVATTAPTATPTTAPTTPPIGASACPYGKGTLDADCARGSSLYLEDVERALTEVVRRRPDIFDLGTEPSPGVYRVLKVADYFAGVVQQLQGAGFCAEGDGVQMVQLKKSNDLSEKYAILTSDGMMRRGPGSYRDSCRPAIFPVDDADYIDSVRVHFFSIRCPEGITAPDNAEKKLPVGCTGWVSATPKKKDNTDVPAHIHGPDVFWQTYQGEGENLVKISDVPGQPFNKLVDALDEGYFSMCATVKSVRGCFGFDIIR